MANTQHINTRHIFDTTIVTCVGDDPVVFENHSIVLEANVITQVGPTADLERELGKRDDLERFDGSRHVVIPGLINTHHHLYQSLTRGLACVQNAELFDWLTELYTRWRNLSHETVKLAAQVSIGELLLSGCTTTSDHFYIFPQNTDVRVESVLEAASSLGMRIHVCRGSMSVGKSSGGLPPDDCVQDERTIMQDCARAIDAFHDADPMSMVRIDLAPCSPFSISPELLRETATFARERGVLLHTHAAETLDEERYCVERFGKRPIDYLAECGWLGDDVYLAHCVHLSKDDIKLLAKTKTGVAHCPCSNMRLGSGVPAIADLLREGVRVGLGVDGSSSNDGGHVLAEARQALLLQRVDGGAAAMTTADAFRMATIGGAQLLGRKTLGRIAPGFAADLAMYRTDDIALAGAVAQDPMGALMLCHVGRADRVYVNGRVVVDQGQLAMQDERKLARDLNKIVAQQFR
jgi:cytosine/adenosine deaminase-related metal-dependent hydrolase